VANSERFLKRICRDVFADCDEDMRFFVEHMRADDESTVAVSPTLA
jgi:hypothetical protein